MARDSSPVHRSRWLTSPLTRSLFGQKAPFSVVTYRGRRRTDVVAQAPVLAFPHRGGFAIAVLPRSRPEWVGIVLNGGGCRLQYGHRRYALQAPVVFRTHPSEITMPRWLRALFVVTGVGDYLYMTVHFAGPATPAGDDETP
jgi:hypothetical protein